MAVLPGIKLEDRNLLADGVDPVAYDISRYPADFYSRALYAFLHAFCAAIFHSCIHMDICMQSKCCSVMPQILLNRFNATLGFKAVYGEAVSQIKKAHIAISRFFNCNFEGWIYGMVTQASACLRGEDQVVLIFLHTAALFSPALLLGFFSELT